MSGNPNIPDLKCAGCGFEVHGPLGWYDPRLTSRMFGWTAPDEGPCFCQTCTEKAKEAEPLPRCILGGRSDDDRRVPRDEWKPQSTLVIPIAAARLTVNAPNASGEIAAAGTLHFEKKDEWGVHDTSMPPRHRVRFALSFDIDQGGDMMTIDAGPEEPRHYRFRYPVPQPAPESEE